MQKNGFALSTILLIFFLMTSGCMDTNQTSNTQQQPQTTNNIVQQSPQTFTTYIPGSSAYGCFQLTGVSEKFLSSGYLGKNIADTRRVTGTLKNNCGKIMPVFITIRWFDENGKSAYYGMPIAFYRLKTGESTDFQIDGYHTDVNNRGYLEEIKGWTFKIGLGDHAVDLL